MITSRHRTIAVLASALALGGAAAASAHTQVKSTTPTSGGTARTTLARVTVTFTGDVRSGTLRVLGPSGRVVSASGGGVDPRKPTRLLAGLKRSLKPGSYTARWTVVASDGHKQKGSFGFKVKR